MSRAPPTSQETITVGSTHTQRRAAAIAFITANRNSNTQRTYLSAYGQFRHWAITIADPSRMQGEHVHLDRPSEVDICEYVQYMGVTMHYKTATIDGAVSAIADHIRYITTDSYDPCAGQLLQQTRAVMKPSAPVAEQKTHLTIADLHSICMATRPYTVGSIERRDGLMFALAFHTLLRVSEVVRLDLRDITFDTDTPMGMTVHVDKRAKNDAQRRGHNRRVQADDTAATCVVREMRAYFTTLPHDVQTTRALFVTSTNERLSINTPGGRLKKWIAKAIPSAAVSTFGFHSLRAGGATAAMQHNVPGHVVQASGGWKSDAYKLYCRQGPTERLSVSAALNRATPRAASTTSTSDE